jgi:hypothetical protein
MKDPTLEDRIPDWKAMPFGQENTQNNSLARREQIKPECGQWQLDVHQRQTVSLTQSDE